MLNYVVIKHIEIQKFILATTNSIQLRRKFQNKTMFNFSYKYIWLFSPLYDPPHDLIRQEHSNWFRKLSPQKITFLACNTFFAYEQVNNYLLSSYVNFSVFFWYCSKHISSDYRNSHEYTLFTIQCRPVLIFIWEIVHIKPQYKFSDFNFHIANFLCLYILNIYETVYYLKE